MPVTTNICKLKDVTYAIANRTNLIIRYSDLANQERKEHMLLEIRDS